MSAYEPFNYTTSIPTATPSTATGFTGNWTCGATPAVVAGMTYAALPTANNSSSSTSGRQSVAFASPLASGTKWISFLFSQSGNNGGNISGLYFPNGGTGLYFGFGLAPFSGTQGGLGLGSTATASTSPQGAANLASSFLGTYGTTYLVALKIDFNTSGNNDTVTVYLNPTANSSVPGVIATYTVNSFDVGTITGIGFQNQGGGFAIKADEIRVGDSYADVAGVVGTPVAPFITGITPSTGLTNGGTVVTISGSNFLSGVTVKFGANFGAGISLTGSTNITEARIDDAVRRILTVKFQMGVFENPWTDPALTAKIGSPEHRAVARDCVRESLVLLKNSGQTLPLNKNLKHLAIGGNYLGNPTTNEINTGSVFPGEMQVDYVRLYHVTDPFRLAIKTTGTNLLLTWPSNIVSRVQTQTNLGVNGTNWIQVVTTTNQLQVSPTNKGAFYRLVMP